MTNLESTCHLFCNSLLAVQEVHSLAQDLTLDFSPGEWPGEMVKQPKYGQRTTRDAMKAQRHCPLVATEGSVKVCTTVFDTNMRYWAFHAHNNWTNICVNNGT